MKSGSIWFSQSESNLISESTSNEMQLIGFQSRYALKIVVDN